MLDVSSKKWYVGLYDLYDGALQTNAIYETPYEPERDKLVASRICNKQDAYLISAAPSMYEALNLLLKDFDCVVNNPGSWESRELALKALSKAEGK